MLSKFILEGGIEFREVTWDLGLKSGTNPSVTGTTLMKIVHRSSLALVVGASGAS